MKDMEEIAALLSVHEKTIQHGGALNHIANAAMKRLQEINAEYDPRKPSTHQRTAFDTEVPPRRVTPPEGPANSAVELDDGSIERVQPVVAPTDGPRYHHDGKPVIVEPEGTPEPVDEPIDEVPTPVVERRTL